MKLIAALLLYMKGNKEATIVLLVVNLFSDSLVKKIAYGKNKRILMKIREEIKEWASEYQN